ncbi:uncharacterized protein [Asterias amurensis]|uniref:uncharacterized protein n=1 Tax=Asterias amurensis TaxID=7602 RepID=UPI003AB7873E
MSISFNLSDNFEIPQEQEEATIADPTLHEELEGLGDVPVTSFKITTGGTVQGKNILVDSNGYTYTMKWKKDPTPPFSAWVCGLQSKTQGCPVSVLQHGDQFKFGHNEHHLHPAVGDVVVAVKKAAKDNVFRPASDIVEGVLTTEGVLPADAPVNCPRHGNLTRAANRARQRQRPQEPQDQDFKVIMNSVPEGFLQDDIHAGESRHVIFATPEQMAALDGAKTWYLDGTFKIVKRPSYQLFTIHAFAKSYSGEQEQVPLAYCFIGSRTKADYKKILKTFQFYMVCRIFIT